MDSLGRQSSELLTVAEYLGNGRSETAIGDKRNALGDPEDTNRKVAE